MIDRDFSGLSESIYLSILSPVWLWFMTKPVAQSLLSLCLHHHPSPSAHHWHLCPFGTSLSVAWTRQQSYYDHQPPPDDKPTTMDCSLTMTTTGQPPPDLNPRTHSLSLSLCPLPYYEPHSHPFTFSPGTRLSLADTEFVESPYNHIYGRLPLPTHYIPSTPRMYVGEWD